MAFDASIGGGVSISGTLDDAADSDAYTVVLNGGETYEFWATPLNPEGLPLAVDLKLALADAGGTVEADNDSAEGAAPGNPTFLYAPAATGIFTLTIDDLDNTDSGDYALTIVNKSRTDDIGDHTFATEIIPGGGPGGVDAFDIPRPRPAAPRRSAPTRCWPRRTSSSPS